MCARAKTHFIIIPSFFYTHTLDFVIAFTKKCLPLTFFNVQLEVIKSTHKKGKYLGKFPGAVIYI